MSLNEFEKELIRMDTKTLLRFLEYNNLIQSGMLCEFCRKKLEKRTYKKIHEGVAFQCVNTRCFNYRKMISVRKNSSFEGFRLPILDILQVLVKWANNQRQESIVENMEIDLKTYKRIISEFFNLVKLYDVKMVALEK
jgi:hypothetical protein